MASHEMHPQSGTYFYSMFWDLDLGRMKCTPEFKNVRLLKCAPKAISVFIVLGKAVEFAKRPIPSSK